MQVRDAMHAGVTWVGPETSINELARKMRDEDIGAIPIGENDRLIGMVTDRDIALRCFADGRDVDSMTARDVMTSPINDAETRAYLFFLIGSNAFLLSAIAAYGVITYWRPLRLRRESDIEKGLRDELPKIP